ncbi:hypothetical protein CY34DRAFT_16400 [Suillus luteus UH-Slu-Lm8-n1]|uniref:Uncharacterized protein n=1 Tax=Suillus luteus UH-Slu-Lm8-n1 TaxID=930992 RepID=A0A0D0AE44_9AGAM|nr:hypothetical protein CY34DRAFT_16400 [Suillus luteus UH-Slu-Lm8-n1]
MAELDVDELEKAKEIVEEWLNNYLPPEIQAQVTRKKGPAYMEHFLNEMWRQCRMRVHDDNEEDGHSFIKMKDWKDIELVWQKYMQEQFSARARDGGRQIKGGRKII